MAFFTAMALIFEPMRRLSNVAGNLQVMLASADKVFGYFQESSVDTNQKPVLVDKFLEGAIELDVDLISDGKNVIIGAIMEQIEMAGVHSGDSACVMPPQSISKKVASFE